MTFEEVKQDMDSQLLCNFFTYLMEAYYEF